MTASSEQPTATEPATAPQIAAVEEKAVDSAGGADGVNGVNGPEVIAPPTTAIKPESQSTPEPAKQEEEESTANNAATAHHDDDDDGVNPPDFQGSVDSNNDLPSDETIAKIENYIVLDRDGKSHSFKSLYTGKHVARRVLIIFVRHFYCGNCQEYLRTLSASITPEALLRLPISTFIAVIGCGDPGLIDMYAEATGCKFPIYADPTRKLYAELGMVRTLALGSRPAYMRQGILKSSLASIAQGLKQISSGLATKGGDARQIGGEFLFEPYEVMSPVSTPWAEVERQMGEVGLGEGGGGGGEDGAARQQQRSSDTSLDGKNGGADGPGGEEKRVTWCHRMKTTRDHAEVPELMEVLGLDGQGMPIKDKKRWSRALEERKGTGLSMASQMSAMKADAAVVGGTPAGRPVSP